jgi:hypothetical protein
MRSKQILNDISRNSLLGNGKKIAKFLMRTFTCRSTFLYGRDAQNNTNTSNSSDFSNSRDSIVATAGTVPGIVGMSATVGMPVRTGMLPRAW